MRILKWHLPLEYEGLIGSGKIIHIDQQGNQPFAWTMETPKTLSEQRLIKVVLTGDTFPDYYEHVGTFTISTPHGPYVGHVMATKPRR